MDLSLLGALRSVLITGREISHWWAGQRQPHPDELTTVMPAAGPEFVGRRTQWQAIKRVAGYPADRVRVVAIVGGPAFGKTELARYAAARLARRYCAQLNLDLRGDAGEGERLTTATALTSLLELADIAGPELSSDVAELARRWRARTKEHRILLLLDNAYPDLHLPDLLPAGRGSLVLVTSRTPLPGPPGYDVVQVPLTGLPPEAVGAMFRAAGGALRRGDRRRLDRAGLRVPLALKLLAGAGPGVADLVGGLAGDPGVEGAFALAYERLPDPLAPFLCQLSLHPGAGALTLDDGAAAALAGVPVAQATGHLAELGRRNLVSTPASTPGRATVSAPGRAPEGDRYTLHEQVRTLTRARAAKEVPDGGRAAVERVCEYYRTAAGTAMAGASWLLSRHDQANDPDHPGAGADPEPARTLEAACRAAVEWYERDRVNLLACLRFTREHGWDAHLVGLAATLAGFLRHSGPWETAASLHDQAADAAGRLADRARDANRARWLLDRATALNHAGIARRLLGGRHLDTALDRLATAHALGTELGNELGKANARNEMGIVETERAAAALAGRTMPRNPAAALRRLDHAEAYLTEAYDGYRRPELRGGIGQANAAKNLGVTHYLYGLASGDADRYESADRLFNEAFTHYERIHDWLGVAEVANRLGRLLLESGGAPDRALCHFTDALTLAARTGSRLEQARAYEGLGDCELRMAGTRSPAREQARQRARGHYRMAREQYGRIGAAFNETELSAKLNA